MQLSSLSICQTKCFLSGLVCLGFFKLACADFANREIQAVMVMSAESFTEESKDYFTTTG